ncbi:MAG: hypothetical protein OXE93_05305 [bacterium]|nr:hypothetical protein [bacterium]
MNNHNTYRTQTGRILNDSDIERIAAEVETTDCDIEVLRARQRGHALANAEPLEVVTVRIEPALKTAISARAKKDGITASSVHRQALRHFLGDPKSA